MILRSIALKRMMAAMVEVFCDSFAEVPRRIVLDIDDTEDRVHGGQQLALFNAYYDSRCFQPIHIYEASTGKPVAIILRPGNTRRHRGGAGAASCHRPHRAAGRRSTSWCAATAIMGGRGDGVVRAQAHRLHLRPSGNAVLLRRVGDLARMPRSAASAARARRSAATANSATPPQAGKWSAGSSLASRLDPKVRQPLYRHQPARLTKALYEKVYCAWDEREPDQGAQAAPCL